MDTINNINTYFNNYIIHVWLIKGSDYMNILVLNGSPKGNYSITLQTINYLQLIYPNIHFEILNVGQQIKGLEKKLYKYKNKTRTSWYSFI